MSSADLTALGPAPPSLVERLRDLGARPEDAALAASLAARLARARHASNHRPLRVGVHGPQGSGKSTLCERLVTCLAALGRRAWALSVDDLYLTHTGQRALAAENSNNEYLEHRGYPGTHDIDLGERVLAALSSPAPGVVAVPSYDKSAHAGRGDRRPASAWVEVATPLDVVLFEGWMLGFLPTPEVPEPALAAPNAALAAYAPWRRWVDLWIVLELDPTTPLDTIVQWRVADEHHRRLSGRPALTEAEAHDYIRRFLPAYRLWSVPRSAPGVHLGLGPDRRPLRVTVTPGL